MIELQADKPIKRGIPGTQFYVEIFAGHITIKARGSRRPGVNVNWMLLLRSKEAMVPTSAPAKIRDGLEYLRWAAQKVERRHERKTTKNNP